jgi:hypothetical protein
VKLAVVLAVTDVDLFDLLLAALDNLQKGDEGTALVIRKVNSEGV